MGLVDRIRGRRRGRHDPAAAEGREPRPEADAETRRRDEARGAYSETRARQREEYGGFNVGAAFFGWLVAIALAALLVALVAAIATGIGFSIELSEAEAEENAETIGVAGGALLIVVLLVGYFGGGYVAGRMSRFDGARQGVGVWLLGLVMSILLILAGLIFGSEYNLLQEIEVPTVPIDSGDLTAGGAITLAAIVLGTIVAAALGGKAGERYHRKVDRAGLMR